MKYIFTKNPEGAFTQAEIATMKVSELPEVILVYVDPKETFKVEPRKKPFKQEMVTTWQFDRLSNVQKELVKELFEGGYIKEIINIFAEARVFPDTVCDTCIEKLKVEVSINVKKALNKGSL